MSRPGKTYTLYATYLPVDYHAVDLSIVLGTSCGRLGDMVHTLKRVAISGVADVYLFTHIDVLCCPEDYLAFRADRFAVEFTVSLPILTTPCAIWAVAVVEE